MSSCGWLRADPRAGTGDAPAVTAAPEPPLSCPGQAGAADLSRIYLPPLPSEANSGLDDQGCSLAGLKETGRGTKNGVTESGP